MPPSPNACPALSLCNSLWNQGSCEVNEEKRIHPPNQPETQIFQSLFSLFLIDHIFHMPYSSCCCFISSSCGANDRETSNPYLQNTILTLPVSTFDTQNQSGWDWNFRIRKKGSTPALPTINSVLLNTS